MGGLLAFGQTVNGSGGCNFCGIAQLRTIFRILSESACPLGGGAISLATRRLWMQHTYGVLVMSGLPLTVIVLMVTVLMVPGAVAAQVDGDVLRALQFYQSSVGGASGRYVLTIDPVSGYQSGSGRALMEDLRSDVQFVAEMRSQRTRVDELRRWRYSWAKQGGEFAIRELRTFDGSQPEALWFTFAESPVPVEIPRSVPMYLKVAAGNTIAAAFGPWHFCGLRLFGTPNRSLLDLVSRGALHVSGTEDVDGESCIVLIGEDDGKRWTVWIDAAVDYLPRKINCVLSDDGTSVTLTIDGFTQFDDGSGNRRWFPESGEATAYGWRYGYKLAELQLNPDIDDGDFVIDRAELPPGVRISDGTTVAYTHGDQQRFDELKSLTDASDRIMEKWYHEFHATSLNRESGETSGVLRVPGSRGRDWSWLITGAMVVWAVISGRAAFRLFRRR
jgi:hypothetical protein